MKRYLLAVGFILSLILTIGLAGPAAFSSGSDLGVAMGVLMIVCIIPFWVWLIKEICK